MGTNVSHRFTLLSLIWLLGVWVQPVEGAKRTMDFSELMKVRKIEQPVISELGDWVAYALVPDRGDAEAVVRSAGGRRQYRVPRGAAPLISADGAWVALRLDPSFEEQETAEKDEVSRPGAVLLATSSGDTLQWAEVQRFAFTEDGRWLAVLHHPPEADEAEADSTQAAATPDSLAAGEQAQEREAGGLLRLRDLSQGVEWQIRDVAEFAFDPNSKHLAYTVQTTDGKQNALVLRSLSSEKGEDLVLHHAERAAYPVVSWAEESSLLGFLSGKEEEPGTITEVELGLFDGSAAAEGARTLVSTETLADGWMIPDENELRWTRDGERVFVGLRPPDEDAAGVAGAAEADSAESEEAAFDPYDFEAIRADTELDVWHWNDSRIQSHQRNSWDEEKNRVYLAVIHLDDGSMVPLADEEMPDIEIGESPQFVLGRSNLPYLKRMTWDGFYDDVYVVDLHTGERRLAVEQTQDVVSLSPQGGHLVYFREGNWWLYDVEGDRHREMTSQLGVPFADEDHDYPRTVPGYGVAGWTADESAALVYDKYDIWVLPTAESELPYCLTGSEGRSLQRSFRVVDLDPERDDFEPDERLLLLAADERAKNSSFYSAQLGLESVDRLREQPKLFNFVAKAKHADRLLYTEESFVEFPDLWISDLSLRRPRKLSDANPQLKDFDLGSAELVEWNSLDGIPLQGVLIKPADYDPDRRYPVLVYYYRFMSQRLHDFNEPVVNHRPSFYVYAGDGYCVFLPDIRFEIGRPGFSATKCLVPGVQRLIDMGIADPKGIGLHGHSWSGYQTAQVITQTNIFAGAVAGAPVSNMVSAYGGIRWGSGLSRQFQYEKSQSRLGASLWERRDLYIENSPVFYADRIQTPLLIQFGDEDEAVPWWQGIELYMAMRRLEKPCVMLQYRGEPHHLKKYANKLDYSIKMKEFFDHFCKGEEAPGWWIEGVRYQGQ